MIKTATALMALIVATGAVNGCASVPLATPDRSLRARSTRSRRPARRWSTSIETSPSARRCGWACSSTVSTWATAPRRPTSSPRSPRAQHDRLEGGERRDAANRGPARPPFFDHRPERGEDGCVLRALPAAPHVGHRRRDRDGGVQAHPHAPPPGAPPGFTPPPPQPAPVAAAVPPTAPPAPPPAAPTAP